MDGRASGQQLTDAFGWRQSSLGYRQKINDLLYSTHHDARSVLRRQLTNRGHRPPARLTRIFLAHTYCNVQIQKRQVERSWGG